MRILDPWDPCSDLEGYHLRRFRIGGMRTSHQVLMSILIRLHIPFERVPEHGQYYWNLDKLTEKQIGLIRHELLRRKLGLHD